MNLSHIYIILGNGACRQSLKINKRINEATDYNLHENTVNSALMNEANLQKL